MKTALWLCLLPLAAQAEPMTLDTPSGGWAYFGWHDSDHAPRTAYPTPPIDRGQQTRRTWISGRIQAASGARTMVVNGNPSVLNVDKQGQFRRGYTLGGGSNSIEIRSGNARKQVQFYEANPNRVAPQLRILCSWDAPETEIDLHILTPDGQHAFWAHPVLRDGGGLDVDSVDGPGPEMFTALLPQHGAYHVYVNYWGNLGASGYNFDPEQRQHDIIITVVTLVFYENTPNEKRESFTVPLRNIGDLNLVKTFYF